MVNKILQWLNKIKTDKLLHFIAGILIAQLTYILLSFTTTLHICWVSVLSLLTTAIIGGVKEAYDKKHGVPSLSDFIYTVIGGLVGILFAIFISL